MLTIEAKALHRIKLKLIILAALICVSTTGWLLTTFWIFHYEKKLEYQQAVYGAMEKWYRENTVPMRK